MLIAFYRRIRPGGPGWARVARLADSDAASAVSPALSTPLLAACLGSATVYAVLFATGSLLYGRAAQAAASGAVALLGGILLARVWFRRGEHLMEGP